MNTRIQKMTAALTQDNPWLKDLEFAEVWAEILWEDKESHDEQQFFSNTKVKTTYDTRRAMAIAHMEDWQLNIIPVKDNIESIAPAMETLIEGEINEAAPLLLEHGEDGSNTIYNACDFPARDWITFGHEKFAGIQAAYDAVMAESWVFNVLPLREDNERMGNVGRMMEFGPWAEAALEKVSGETE